VNGVGRGMERDVRMGKEGYRREKVGGRTI